MDDDMCCLLMAHLRQNSRVTSLDLSENRIGFKESSGGIAQGALEPQLSSEHGVPDPQPTIGEAIATMLEENSTLTNLELSWNFIAAGAAVAIARALGDNDALKELNVSHNAFHDTDRALPAQEIGRSLRRNTGLIRLDLR